MKQFIFIENLFISNGEFEIQHQAIIKTTILLFMSILDNGNELI